MFIVGVLLVTSGVLDRSTSRGCCSRRSPVRAHSSTAGRSVLRTRPSPSSCGRTSSARRAACSAARPSLGCSRSTSCRARSGWSTGTWRSWGRSPSMPRSVREPRSSCWAATGSGASMTSCSTTRTARTRAPSTGACWRTWPCRWASSGRVPRRTRRPGAHRRRRGRDQAGGARRVSSTPTLDIDGKLAGGPPDGPG